MSKIVILGSGICGLAAAILLTQDGHDVTVPERDNQPLPASGDEAWRAWDRQGVAQFRQAHYLQPGGGHVTVHARCSSAARPSPQRGQGQ